MAMNSSNVGKPLNLMEDSVQILSSSGFSSNLLTGERYLIYFVDENLVALYRSNQKKRNNTELPIEIFYLEELQNLNFRIPQKLNDLEFIFKKEDKSLVLYFSSETIKNEIGDFMKKQVKKILSEIEKKQSGKDFDESIFPVRDYTLIEMKYKLAKQMEGQLKSRKYLEIC